MLKPTVIYCIGGAYMLRPGWLNRYRPPIAVEAVSDRAYLFCFIWAGLMFGSAALNVALALLLDAASWAAAMSAWSIASKLGLFLVQYAVMRMIGRRRAVAATAPRSAAMST